MSLKTKKRLSLFVITIMLLSLVPLNAFGVAGPSLTLNKAAFTASETITVTVAGLTTEQINDQSAYAGIFKAGSTDNASTYNGMYSYVSDLAASANKWTTRVPAEIGSYEVRLIVYVDGKYTSLGSVPFTVASSVAKAGDVTLDKTTYLANEKMSITIKGLTEGQIENSAWAGLFRASDKISANAFNGKYTYVTDLSNTANVWSVDAPDILGSYELRVLTANPNANELGSYVFIKVPFTVGSSTAVSGNITAKDGIVDFTVNAPAAITIKGITQGQMDNSAWAGLFKVTDKISANSYNGTYAYISDLANKDDTWNFKLPAELGAYEIRVFTADPSDATTRDAVLYGKLAVNVVNSVAKAGDITMDKKNFYLGEKMMVTIEGLTQGQLEAGAWAGIYKITDKIDAPALNYVYMEDFRDGKTWEGLNAPETAGVYEMRIYTQNLSDALMLKSVEFSRITFNVMNKSKLINWKNSSLKAAKFSQPIGIDKTVQLKIYAQNSKTKKTVNVTDQVLYNSTDPAVAIVTPEGVIKGMSSGKAQIIIVADKTHKLVLNITVGE